eukprot:CAMPEP_0170318292 /NCGR_PEP_ID=MMETSP0116_2-20130129/59841_1 /TAXON_ID=400756 /ORGANISM="Durinskia baltica, Strain CSIRO CS-38" /LENGTH=32 /DNA_ID= /DNA_START= /DNA_END= /DNA_ORIENTATION=
MTSREAPGHDEARRRKSKATDGRAGDVLTSAY